MMATIGALSVRAMSSVAPAAARSNGPGRTGTTVKVARLMSDAPHGNLQLLEDPEFKDLVSRKNRFSILLTVITLVIYYGFILLIAFNRDVFASKVFGNVTFGILLGIILLLIGYFTSLSILYTIGGILVVVGVILWILGAVGRPVGGRKVWF